MGAIQIDHEQLDRDIAESVLGDLVRGYWISYGDPEYPDEYIREFPDGSRESSHMDADRNITKVRDIPPVDYMCPDRIAKELAQHYWTSYPDPEYPGVLVREYPDGRRTILHVTTGELNRSDITEGREIPPRKARACPAPELAPT